MSKYKPTVAIRNGEAIEKMTCEALIESVALNLQGKRILIKPNIGFLSERESGVVTNPKVVAGVIRWAKSRGASEILVGDSCISGVDTDEAFVLSGMKDMADREGVQMVHLDRADVIDLKVPNPLILDSIRISSIAYNADLIISVPVVKSHMHTGATLSTKNMKGILHRKEKMRMHHLHHPVNGSFQDWRTLDLAIADLASAIPPQISVLDATIVLEGMGPLIGEPRRLDTVIVSEDAIAADLAGIKLIGFDKNQVPHVMLTAMKQGRPDVTLNDFDIDHKFLSTIQTPLKRAVPEDISATYPYFLLTSKNACSACESTAMAFLKTYGKEFIGERKTQILLGKAISEKDICSKNCILLGNCTGKIRKKGIYIKGCPPIPSDLKEVLS